MREPVRVRSLGATAQTVISDRVVFQVGLAAAVVAAVLSAWAFLPRRYPLLGVERLRQSNLTASEAETRLELLDTQIVMVKEAATLVQQKGWRIRAAVACLAIAAEAVSGIRSGSSNRSICSDPERWAARLTTRAGSALAGTAFPAGRPDLWWPAESTGGPPDDACAGDG